MASAAKEDLDHAEQLDVHLEPKLWTDDNLLIVLADVKILLERFASGHSLDPMITIFKRFMDDMASSLFDPELQSFLSDVGSWLDQALSDREYATSPEGKKEAEVLYDRGQTLTAEDTKFGKDLRAFFIEMDSYLADLKLDKSSQRLFNSIDALSRDFTALFRNQPAQMVEELKQDAISWFLPRLLRTIRTIPMPRIEFINDTMEVALDALVLTASSTVSSLTPDHIRIANWNELVIDVGEETVRRNRIRVHVDGLRLSAKNLGYYLRYKGPGFIGYEDQGLLSMFVGEDPGEGLTFDVDLEIDVDVGKDEIKTLFQTRDVQASVKGLRFAINRSNHWILNKLLIQPFAGPIVRKIFESMVSQYIRTGLDALSEFAGNVQKDVQKSSSAPSFGEYWSAIMRHASPEEEEEDAPEVSVHTEATLKGIIRTTQEDTDSSSSPHTPAETIISIGIGPQILPDKGLVAQEENSTQVARDALEEVEDVVDGVKGKTQEVIDETEAETRRVLDGTTKRFEERKKVERKSGGWKSSAFDLW